MNFDAAHSYAVDLSDTEIHVVADRMNCEVEFSTPTVLQLDLDSEEDVDRFVELYQLAQDVGLLPVRGYLERASRNGNSHVTITLDEEMTIEQRILLQAVLGSDPKRELLSYTRYKRGHPNPIRLFRPIEVIEPPFVPLDDDDLPF